VHIEIENFIPELLSFAGCFVGFAGCFVGFAGCFVGFAGCFVGFAGCFVGFAGCFVGFAGCFIRFAGCFVGFAGCFVGFAGCFLPPTFSLPTFVSFPPLRLLFAGARCYLHIKRLPQWFQYGERQTPVPFHKLVFKFADLLSVSFV